MSATWLLRGSGKRARRCLGKHPPRPGGMTALVPLLDWPLPQRPVLPDPRGSCTAPTAGTASPGSSRGGGSQGAMVKQGAHGPSSHAHRAQPGLRVEAPRRGLALPRSRPWPRGDDAGESTLATGARQGRCLGAAAEGHQPLDAEGVRALGRLRARASRAVVQARGTENCYQNRATKRTQ